MFTQRGGDAIERSGPAECCGSAANAGSGLQRLGTFKRSLDVSAQGTGHGQPGLSAAGFMAPRGRRGLREPAGAQRSLGTRDDRVSSCSTGSCRKAVAQPTRGHPASPALYPRAELEASRRAAAPVRTTSDV